MLIAQSQYEVRASRLSSIRVTSVTTNHDYLFLHSLAMGKNEHIKPPSIRDVRYQPCGLVRTSSSYLPFALPYGMQVLGCLRFVDLERVVDCDLMWKLTTVTLKSYFGNAGLVYVLEILTEGKFSQQA
jgi:hypothetical protein